MPTKEEMYSTTSEVLRALKVPEEWERWRSSIVWQVNNPTLAKLRVNCRLRQATTVTSVSPHDRDFHESEGNIKRGKVIIIVQPSCLPSEQAIDKSTHSRWCLQGYHGRDDKISETSVRLTFLEWRHYRQWSGYVFSVATKSVSKCAYRLFCCSLAGFFFYTITGGFNLFTLYLLLFVLHFSFQFRFFLYIFSIFLFNFLNPSINFFLSFFPLFSMLLNFFFSRRFGLILLLSLPGIVVFLMYLHFSSVFLTIHFSFFTVNSFFGTCFSNLTFFYIPYSVLFFDVSLFHHSNLHIFPLQIFSTRFIRCI